MTEDYEYKVDHTYGGVSFGSTGRTPDSQHAGGAYRAIRKSIESGGAGGIVELYRRKLGPWELVEKTEILGKEL